MDTASLLDFVNPLQGSRSGPEFSRGDTQPLVQRPGAPTAWSLVTGDDPWYFHPDLPKLRGLRCVSGAFDLSPQTGPLVTDPARRASAYRLDRSLVAPYRLKTEFLRYRVAVDLAPSETGAVLRTTWGEGGVSRLLFEVRGGSAVFDEATGEVRIQTREAGVHRVVFDRSVARKGGEGSTFWVEFDLPRGAVIELRLSAGEGALDREATVESLAEDAADLWRRLLERFQIEGGTEDQKRTFYSCLYRVLCGGSRPSPVSHRTVAPLYALAYRDLLAERIETWTRVPGCGEAVLAEALVHGIPGFDPMPAWEYLKSQASKLPSSSEVSSTLERAYADWCLSRIGHALGRDDEARPFGDRAQRWQTLFDPSMGFFRPLDPDGSWTEGFNPLAWGGPFAEGSAWQGGWVVPHDPEGLIAALGGTEVTLARLDTLLALKPLFHLGAHDREIPAMTQMATADFGQYAHSLSSTHGILWHYALAGRPDKTERLTRRVLDELYGPGVDGFCGNAGDGDLAAWYLWAALGLYPLCPGSGEYILGSPLFPKVTISSGDGGTLVIEAPGNGPETPLVRKRTLGNVVLTDARVSRADLFDLGHLVCEMQ